MILHEKLRNYVWVLCVMQAVVGWMMTGVSAIQETKVVSFVPYNECTIFTETLPDGDSIKNLLPDTATAVLEDGSRTEVPVNWSWWEERPGEWIVCLGSWDETMYPKASSAERVAPFMEIIVANPEEAAQRMEDALQNERFAASKGIDNIVRRAYQQVTIPWTPVQTVDGYLNSEKIMTAVYQAGTTYHGLPYGMQVAGGRYVPLGASFDTFLSAVKDGNSLFYSKRGSYPAFHNVTSTYYASDCAAFVGYCYGFSNYLTTYTIYSSYQFPRVNALNDVQVGDCLLEVNSHVMLITGVKYNSDGTVAALEVSQETPPKAKTSIYDYDAIQGLFKKGYIIKRYAYRDNVAAPVNYSGYNSNLVPFGRCDVNLEYDKVGYDGTEHKPTVTVTDSTTLIEGVDYTVAYLNNIHSGEATVRITPCGKYSGDPVQLSFSILSPLPFTDYQTAAWSFAQVMEAYEKGFVHGVSKTELAPGATVSRAQAVQFLYNLDGEKEAESPACTFRDVDQNAWYAKAINWAAENTVVQGYSMEAFGTEDPMNREQFAKVIVGYLENVCGYHLKATAYTYTDNEKISPWAKDYLEKAQNIGLFYGYPDGSFGPQEPITREQAVVLIVRLSHFLSENPVSESGEAVVPDSKEDVIPDKDSIS